MRASAASIACPDAACSARSLASSPRAFAATRSSLDASRSALVCSDRACCSCVSSGMACGCSGALAAASKGRTTRAAAVRIRLSFAMIGMVRKDGGRAEQLLREHGPDEQVRPGCRAERKQEVGRAPLRFLVAVSRADQEAGLSLPLVAPGLELPGEFRGGQGRAALVHCDGHAVA